MVRRSPRGAAARLSSREIERLLRLELEDDAEEMVSWADAACAGAGRTAEDEKKWRRCGGDIAADIAGETPQEVGEASRRPRGEAGECGEEGDPDRDRARLEAPREEAEVEPMGQIRKEDGGLSALVEFSLHVRVRVAHAFGGDYIDIVGNADLHEGCAEVDRMARSTAPGPYDAAWRKRGPALGSRTEGPFVHERCADLARLARTAASGLAHSWDSETHLSPAGGRTPGAGWDDDAGCAPHRGPGPRPHPGPRRRNLSPRSARMRGPVHERCADLASIAFGGGSRDACEARIREQRVVPTSGVMPAQKSQPGPGPFGRAGELRKRQHPAKQEPSHAAINGGGAILKRHSRYADLLETDRPGPARTLDAGRRQRPLFAPDEHRVLPSKSHAEAEQSAARLLRQLRGGGPPQTPANGGTPWDTRPRDSGRWVRASSPTAREVESGEILQHSSKEAGFTGPASSLVASIKLELRRPEKRPRSESTPPGSQEITPPNTHGTAPPSLQGNAICFPLSGDAASRPATASDVRFLHECCALTHDIARLYDGSDAATWTEGSALVIRLKAFLEEDFMREGPKGFPRHLCLTLRERRYTVWLRDGEVAIDEDARKLKHFDVALNCETASMLRDSLDGDLSKLFFGVFSELLLSGRSIVPIDKLYPKKWEIVAGQKSKGGLRSKTFFDRGASGAYLGNVVRRLIILRGLDDGNTRERFFSMLGIFTTETMRLSMQNIRAMLGTDAVLRYDVAKLADVDVSSQTVEDIKEKAKRVHVELRRELQDTRENVNVFEARLARHLDGVIAAMTGPAEARAGGNSL